MAASLLYRASTGRDYTVAAGEPKKHAFFNSPQDQVPLAIDNYPATDALSNLE
jgi:hypothetical protein